MHDFDLLPITDDLAADEVIAVVDDWVETHVPQPWRDAATGGTSAIRAVRRREDYIAWYPTLARSGLVVPTWPRAYGGLDVGVAIARAIDARLAPFNLGRLNPLGLNLAAPALFAHGTEEQRLRFLPRIVAATEIWCQLFSEPGAGSDLASLATRAVRDEAGWVITGQKVWTTWAHEADYGVLLARTDPTVPKRRGITYFLVPLSAPGVEVRPLRHLTGEIDFNEVFLDEVRIADDHRLGAVGAGWKVAGATLSGERQMVSGAGSGGVDRIGGASAARVVDLARERPGRTRGSGHRNVPPTPGSPSTTAPAAPGRQVPTAWQDPLVRQRLVRLWSEEQIRRWTNLRVRSALAANQSPGAASSIGKILQGQLNQAVQVAAVDLLGADALAWETEPPAASRHEGEPPVGEPTVGDTGADDGATRDAPATYGASLPFWVQGMLRSRANTIEGGTTEVNKNILAERVLGLPREPDPYTDAPWSEVPRDG